MSFILDALRKAERDRSLGQAPRIEDVALAPETSAENPGLALDSTRLFILTGLAAAILLGLYLLLRPAPEVAPIGPAAPTGVVTATIRGPAPVSSTPAPTPTQGRDATPPALVDDGTIASLDDLDGNVDLEPAEASESSPIPAAEARQEAADFIAHPASPTAAAEPLTSPKSATPAASEQAATTSLTSGATPLDEMPNDYRAGFPTLSVEVHVWDSSSAKRFVMINGQRYREGDTLAAGPKLAEIAQDGLVLDYHGSVVLLSLLQ